MDFTVLGANGFIGNSLANWLRRRGHNVFTPSRGLSPESLAISLSGHVMYCIGLTADFRSRPWDTVDAHVGVLRKILERGQFASLTYLSSTRVYLGCEVGREDSQLYVWPNQFDQMYNLSKLLGESLCHVAHKPRRPVRVIRLSNVVGGDLKSGNFIYSLIQEALSRGAFSLNTTLDSVKDYIALEDVVYMLEKVALHGRLSCYNLASGKQTSNRDVAQAVSNLTGAPFKVSSHATANSFPPIDIRRLADEFDFKPLSPMDKIAEMSLQDLKKQYWRT
jgi:nucleoside-diphosphate-sugar epimerase